jgi:pyrophosphatase PpaX
MPRYTTVLFDLDGTLIDSIELILESYHHTFAVYGLPPRPDDELVRGIGIPLRSLLAGYSKDPGLVDAMVETYRAWNLDHHDRRVSVYPGAAECVRALGRAGVRLGLVTSKGRHSALRGLALAALTELFPVLVCAEDVTRPKPHREPVDRALSLLGASAEDALFVGDSLHDMHAGRHAEVATGAALWGPFSREDLRASEPRHWLEKPADVLALVLG